MKTIPLRQLMRQPAKVKKWTRAGQTVQITDNGEPLWLIQPAVTEEDEERRQREIEAELAEVLRGPRSKIALSKLVIESRR